MTLRIGALAVLGLALALASTRAALAQETASAEAPIGGLLARPAPRPAQSLDPELDAIAAQLGSLASSKATADVVVKAAIEHGKRAVLQATRALAAGDRATAARKKQLARAALELAQRAVARREETRAESAASQNAVQAEQANAQAAVSLEQARAQWQSLQTEPR
jgi:hypothetical protein